MQFVTPLIKQLEPQSTTDGSVLPVLQTSATPGGVETESTFRSVVVALSAILFLFVGTALQPVQAQEVFTFDNQGYQNEEIVSSPLTLTEGAFTLTFEDVNTTVPDFEYLNPPGDLNYQASGELEIRSDDGSEFNAQQIDLGFSDDTFLITTDDAVITGFRDGSQVAQLTGVSFSSPPKSTIVLSGADPGFSNVDRVRIDVGTIASEDDPITNEFVTFDNVTVSAAGAANNAPQFTATGPFSVTEGASAGTTVGDVDANDGDGGGTDAGVAYSITSGNTSSAFAIDSDTGVISINTPSAVDFESNASFSLTVEADDGQTTNNTATTTVSVSVLDAPPSQPVDTDAASNVVTENAASGTAVGVTGFSADPSGGTVTYALTNDASGRFQINASTGEVTVADGSLLDFESATSHTIRLVAEDSDGTSSAATDITVNVGDATEAPVASTGAASGVTTSEATLNGTVGTGGGPDASITFEYYVTADGAGSATTVGATPGTVTAESGASVSADLTGLQPNTDYTYEVIAATAEGTTGGGAQTFTTSGVPEADLFAETSPSRTAIPDGGSYDYGTVDLGATVSQTFTVENNGSADLIISNVSSSGSSDFQLVSTPSSPTIAPGSQAQLEVSFTPSGIGARSFTVSVDNNDPDENPYTVTLEGTGDPIPPTSTTDAASSITATTATLNGTVNPGGASTDVEFSYFETAAGSGSATTVTAAESLLTGTTDQAVTASITGLTPGAEYTFSVSASNSEGSETGADLTFTTGAQTPAASITAPAASDIGGTTVDLSGTVNPNGSSTTVDFELTPDGGTAFTVAANESPITGNTDQTVTATATGLTSGTSYSVRVIATNSEGTDASSDVSFTTNLERVISGTDGTGNDVGYRMLATPTAATQADLEDDLDFSVSSGALLHTYDGTQWVEGTSSTALDRGRGFVLYFFDDATDPLGSSGITLDVPSNEEDQSVDVTVSGLANTELNQVLGNPFTVEFDLAGLAGGDLAAAGFQSGVQVWNPDLGSYEVIFQGDADDNIPAWQGFVVERIATGSGTESVTFAASGRLTGAGTLIGSASTVGPLATTPSDDAAKNGAVRQAEAKTSFEAATLPLSLLVQGETTTHQDRALVRFDTRATAGWDGLELTDIPPPATDAYAQMSFPVERSGQTVQRVVASEPLSAAGLASDVDLLLPITVRSTDAGGTATIAWPTDARDEVPAEWLVQLIDTQENARVDLRTDAYTFTMPANGDVTGRFQLKVLGGDALPVTLAKFVATADDRQVQLSWQTAGEENNDGFAIERSIATAEKSEAGWTQIGFVPGAGTTSEPQSYQFRDADVPTDAMEVSYRLRQQDVDGGFTYSDPQTATLSAPDAFALGDPYPNPSAGQVNVDIAVPRAQTVRVEVYDLLGRRVTTVMDKSMAAPGATVTVNTERWAPGVYFVRMIAGETIKTQRLTVVR